MEPRSSRRRGASIALLFALFALSLLSGCVYHRHCGDPYGEVVAVLDFWTWCW